MKENHFQEEETYLFSSLLDRLKELHEKGINLMTKCLLAIFWRIYGEKELLEVLLEDIENEIEGYNFDPIRELSRTKKIFACATYKAVVKKVKHGEKIQNYLLYAKESKYWLGQPRIACCLSFLKKNPIGNEARSYMKENFSTWLSEGRDDFIAFGLLALSDEISSGDLHRTLEHIEPRIKDLPLSILSLFLIGISRSAVNLPNKDAIEDKLYQVLKYQLTDAPLTSFDDEGIITAATALYLAKYHRISGYLKKYSAELKETLALKDNFTQETRKANRRNLLLCVILIATIGLACMVFYLPSLVQFKDNPSAFGRFLQALNTKKSLALGSSIVLIIYIIASYLKTGDPVFGIMEYLREKLPGIFKGRDKNV